MMSYKFRISLFILNVFFISILIYQYTFKGLYPGDVGDTKNILMMLENFHQTLLNNDKSFFNFNILFPIKNTAFFSETMWGVAWIYSIFRFMEYDVYEALNFYFFSIISINFIVSYFVFRKLKLSYISCYAAAFIFSCSLPIIAQDVHFHLFFRAAVPLMVLSVLYYFQTKKTYFLSMGIVLLIYQHMD